MAKQTTLWTALPNGYSEDGRSLCVSLLVSPRLEPDFDPRLENFPDFLDWPATLAQTRFVLHFGGDQISVAGIDFAGPTRIGDRLGVPDSQAWTALFTKDTFVRGFAFRDVSKHSVLSYPVADVDRLVRDLYAAVAVSAQDQLPVAATFLADPGWRDLLNAVARNDEQFTIEDTGLRDTRRQFAAFKNGAFRERTLGSNLARLELVHTPPSSPRVDKYDVPKEDARARAEWLGYERTKLPAPDDFQNEIDFHRIVAAMNQYPTLLRRLGLVVDILISRDAFPSALNAVLWAEVSLPPPAPGVVRPPDASPRTHAKLDAAAFDAVPRPNPQAGDFRVADGLLVLDPNTFDLLQADVDGAGLKVTNFARTLLSMRGVPEQQIDPVTRQKRDLGAPALRNAGLSLVHNRRAEGLENSIKRQSQFNKAASTIQHGLPNPDPPPEMFAEDLVRGYRIDIWDDVSRKWHSLCRRNASYDLSEGALVVDVEDEEGTVRLAATTSPDPASNPDIIWLHETLVSWLGWSLCAPPPGRTIGHVEADHSDPVTDADAEVPPGLRLRNAFTALPGSLPRLRYGRKYWIRARVVDLASNSLGLSPRDFGPEKSGVNARHYLRYEPIHPPALALLKPTPTSTETPAEGESMERMAVRSFNDTPLLNSVPTFQRTRRVAVQSRTTERDAEQHGLLDRAGVVDASFFPMLVTRDNSLAEEKVTTGPLAGGDPVETGYAVFEDGAQLPYLPEPLAASIAARIFDHPTFPSDNVIVIPVFDGTAWPDALPFKIEIYDAPGDEPHYDARSRTLLVPLPKAVRARLRLSVKPTRHALGLLGVWDWLTPAQQTQAVTIDGHTMTLEEMALRGQHWMLTPWRTIELVHAVQRPLITPDAPNISIDRFEAATFALPTFVVACSVASTDRLDLRANWNEPFEDAVANELKNVSRTDHAFSVKITDVHAYVGSPEFLLQAPDLVRAGGRFDDRIATKLHEFHDTRYRRIEDWLEATTKFREFMPAALLTEGGDPTKPTEVHIKVIGTPVRTWIPCSAPPPAPEVLYVVPTFGWVRSDDNASKSSWRRGGGLRVYLNRAWNASGYGEMLAVVLPSVAFTGDPNDKPEGHPLKNFVTQWGNDPIWLSPFVAGTGPKRVDFPLARTAPDPDGKWLPSGTPPEEADQPSGAFVVTGLEHPELRTPTAESLVEIAPHDVFFDDERRLWYCDIEVNWGSAYYPFIRLALARYQPVALQDAHLSNVVLADFMPLVPDRWLNVTHTRDPRLRQVNVYGYTYSSSSSHEEALHALSASVRQADGTFIDVHPPPSRRNERARSLGRAAQCRARRGFRLATRSGCRRAARHGSTSTRPADRGVEGQRAGDRAAPSPRVYRPGGRKPARGAVRRAQTLERHGQTS